MQANRIAQRANACLQQHLLTWLALIAITIAVFPASAHADGVDDFFSAVKADNAEKIQALLQRGFDPNLTQKKGGDTGLIMALRDNSMQAFKVLVNARNIDIEAKTQLDETPLMIAAYKGNVAAVTTLLEKGARINRPGWTALHYAAAIGNNEIVQMLLDRSAYIDAESPNKTTPIMMAAREGFILTVKLLLDEGADATLKNELGLSAIDMARRHSHKDIVEGLTYRLKKAGKL